MKNGFPFVNQKILFTKITKLQKKAVHIIVILLFPQLLGAQTYINKDWIQSSSTYTESKFTRNQPIEYVDSLPIRYVNEMLVRFQPHVVQSSAVDNMFKTFGEVSDFIDSETISQLSKNLGLSDFGRFRIYKVFPRLTTSDSISITRATKRNIKVPSFWATFGIILPEGTIDSLVINTLNASSSFIQVASPNYIGMVENTNDPEFLDGNQPGLVTTNEFNDAHINVEPAWAIAENTKQANIKVGVYDSGINWQHEDFGDGTFAGSKIEGGYDYFDGTDLSNTQHEDELGHGTAVAGIIGAIRNNDKGIAGVAGGNALRGKTGVSLYDMKIFGFNNIAPYSVIYNAMVEGAMESTNGNGFGLHIMNHSWSGPREQLLKDANRFSFENEVVFVASSGNDEVEPTPPCYYVSYPSYYNDSWNIKVGANNGTGTRAFFSNCGWDLDVIAPGTSDIVRTTNIENNSSYSEFSGTSAAAPHVSGTVGLMLSYVNNHSQKPNNLAPEDCERLLELHTTKATDPPVEYDDETGYGRLNAGKVLENLILPQYKIMHFNVSVDASNSTLEGACERTRVLDYIEQFNDLPDNYYTVDKYKITVTHSFDIENYAFLEAWVRNSASNLYPSNYSVNHAANYLPKFARERGIKIVDVDLLNSKITLEGYTYHFYEDFLLCEKPLGIWYPIDLNDKADFAYSVYCYDPTLTTENELSFDSSNITIFPNPSDKEISIKINTKLKEDVEVELYNVKGQLLRQITPSSHSFSDGFLLNLDVSFVPAGIYFIKVKSDSFISTEKLIIK